MHRVLNIPPPTQTVVGSSPSKTRKKINNESKAKPLFAGVNNVLGKCADLQTEPDCTQAPACIWQNEQCMAKHSFLEIVEETMLKTVVEQELSILMKPGRDIENEIQKSGLPDSDKQTLLASIRKPRINVERNARLSTQYAELQQQLYKDVQKANAHVLSRRNDYMTVILAKTGDHSVARFWEMFMNEIRNGRKTKAEHTRTKLLKQLRALFKAKKINLNTFTHLSYELKHFQLRQWSYHDSPPQEMDIHAWDELAGDIVVQPPTPSPVTSAPTKPKAQAQKNTSPTQPGLHIKPITWKDVLANKHKDKNKEARLTEPRNIRAIQERANLAFADLIESLSTGVQKMTEIQNQKKHRRQTVDATMNLIKTQSRYPNRRTTSSAVYHRWLSQIHAEYHSEPISEISTTSPESNISLFHILEPIIANLGSQTTYTADILAEVLSPEVLRRLSTPFLVALCGISQSVTDHISQLHSGLPSKEVRTKLARVLSQLTVDSGRVAYQGAQYIYANLPEQSTMEDMLFVLTQGTMYVSASALRTSQSAIQNIPARRIATNTRKVARASTKIAYNTVKGLTQVVAKTATVATNGLGSGVAFAYSQLPEAKQVFELAHELTYSAAYTSVSLSSATVQAIGNSFMQIGRLGAQSSLVFGQYCLRMGRFIQSVGVENVVLNPDIVVYDGDGDGPQSPVEPAPSTRPDSGIVFLPMGGGLFRETHERLQRADPYARHTVHIQKKDGTVVPVIRSTRIALRSNKQVKQK